MEHAIRNPKDVGKYFKEYRIDRYFVVMGGALLYAVGLNLFIVPSSLYSGGIMGLCQIIRTLLSEYLEVSLPAFDIAGLLYWCINIPILLLAIHRIGRSFFLKTIIAITVQTILLSVIPIPATLLLPDNILACCLIGGILCGAGMGIALMGGGCLGGMNIIGMMLVQHNSRLKVGQVNLIMDALVYLICLLMFDIPTVIYSLIYAVMSDLTSDRMHSQTINVEVQIITKGDTKAIEEEIFTSMNRDVTRWEACGDYTGDRVNMLFILVSKYELHQLMDIVNKYDPGAFVMVNEGISIMGNYQVKLQ